MYARCSPLIGLLEYLCVEDECLDEVEVLSACDEDDQKQDVVFLNEACLWEMQAVLLDIQ